MLRFTSEFSGVAAGLSCSLDHSPGPPTPADGALSVLHLAEKWLMNLSVEEKCAQRWVWCSAGRPGSLISCLPPTENTRWINFTAFNLWPLYPWQVSVCWHGFHVLQIFCNLDILMTFYFPLSSKLLLIVSVLFCLSDVLVLKALVCMLFMHDIKCIQAWSLLPFYPEPLSLDKAHVGVELRGVEWSTHAIPK